jgi:hypothetical protein
LLTDDVREFVLELVGVKLRGVLEQLDVGTAALETVLELHFVLGNESLSSVVNGLGELHRDGLRMMDETKVRNGPKKKESRRETNMVSSGSLGNKADISLETLEDGGLLNGPRTAVTEQVLVGNAWNESKSMIRSFQRELNCAK